MLLDYRMPWAFTDQITRSAGKTVGLLAGPGQRWSKAVSAVAAGGARAVPAMH